MHKASAVMYSIANFFTWIIVLLMVAGIALSIVAMTGASKELVEAGFGTAYLVTCIFVLIISLITIALVRKAKAKGTSKGWDVLFLVLGVLGWNIFYFLGGLFGLLERR